MYHIKMTRPQEATSYNPSQFKKLRMLVAKGEGETLEFKRKAAHPEKIVREMIAFANTQGGILLVGVNDDGTIPGLKYPEGESHVIREAMKLCKPQLKYRETFIPIGDARTVIQYEIPESKRKLHFVVISDSVHQSFVRVGDRTIKASREVRQILRQGQYRKNIRFHYGEHEQFLMKYLDAKPYITLKEFVEQSRLKPYQASKKLILLVLANVLRITPHEKGDQYSLAFSPSSAQYH